MKAILSCALLATIVFFVGILGNMELRAGNEETEFNNDECVLINAEVKNQSIQKRDEENFYSFSLPIKLSLMNSTDETVLIIKKAVKIVGVRFADSKSNLEKGVYLHERYSYPSFKQKNILELTETSLNEIEVLSPKNSFEMNFNERFYLVEKKSDNSLGNEISLEELQKIDSLWIECEVALFPMNTMSDDGNKLKASWKNKGNLLLETLTTKPIEVFVPRVTKIN